MTSVPTPEEMTCLDTRDDSIFYGFPRFVQHIDDGFKARLTAFYEQELPRGGCILDLCASWDSHLPDMPFERVVGHGMNEAELRANPKFTSHFLQDLNSNPKLSQVETASMDAVLCCNGVQYLRRPIEVWKEVARVLKPMGIVIVSFSSHCFVEKAFVGWIKRDMHERALFVSNCLEQAGIMVRSHTLWEPDDDNVSVVSDSISEDTLVESRLHHHHVRHEDPFCAVVGARRADPPAGQPLKDSAGGRSRGLQALQEAGNVPFVALALEEMELFNPESQISEEVLARWREAYGCMVKDAVTLGIPFSVIPALPENSGYAEIRAAREHLCGMMASFMSANL